MYSRNQKVSGSRMGEREKEERELFLMEITAMKNISTKVFSLEFFNSANLAILSIPSWGGMYLIYSVSQRPSINVFVELNNPNF